MSKEPKRNVYVGHRYVPKIMGEWDKKETYEGLSIVTNEGTSYTSKKRVPVGVDILNTEYWVVTGNYNAQIEQYRQDVRDMQDSVNEKMDETVDYVDNELVSVNEQLAQTKDDLEGRGINVMNPPPPLIAPVGDGIVDDTQALKNINDILVPGDALYFPFNKKFLTTEMLHFKSGVSYIMNSPIIYDGEGVAVVIGTNSVRTYSVELKLKVEKKEISNWENDNNIGIRINNVYSSNIEIAHVANFTIGVQFYADDNGVVYNNITFGNIQNNRIGVHLANINRGWVNENNFYGGRFWCTSSTNTNKSRFGVVIESLDDGYTNNNNNNFFKPSFELREPLSGEALPILIVHGSQNSFKDCRNEGNSKIFARILNDSNHNVFETGYGRMEIEDLSISPTSVYKTRIFEITDLNRLVFHSGNIVENTCIYDGVETLNVSNLFITSSNGNIHKSISNSELLENSLSLNSSRGVTIRINTERAKRFVVRRDVDVNREGRVFVRCYDVNGSTLYDPNNKYVKGTPARVPAASDEFGGVYRQGSDIGGSFYFILSDEVKSIDVGVSGADIRSFSIYTDEENVPTAFNPLTDVKENLATTPPTVGTWKKGKKVYNDGDLIEGSPIGWVNVVDAGCDFRPFGVIS